MIDGVIFDDFMPTMVASSPDELMLIVKPYLYDLQVADVEDEIYDYLGFEIPMDIDFGIFIND